MLFPVWVLLNGGLINPLYTFIKITLGILEGLIKDAY
jgi:hypothetical protein